MVGYASSGAHHSAGRSRRHSTCRHCHSGGSTPLRILCGHLTPTFSLSASTTRDRPIRTAVRTNVGGEPGQRARGRPFAPQNSHGRSQSQAMIMFSCPCHDLVLSHRGVNRKQRWLCAQAHKSRQSRSAAVPAAYPSADRHLAACARKGGLTGFCEANWSSSPRARSARARSLESKRQH